ncbi:transporter substrate-binding domain-containing protein [Prosthecobacter sp.]|uniref:transporter substrate-binding domain-containing protein n=1 Tax=Prosthecobacter sp. TaxID=1965333 RepID=UPI002ABCDE16|nr:transporter substrate-binding domain-containing protein [Prosthecobacter sp.]MDZ4403900.1 transporter substrate-binding domain-containing protein [Prosthecobacter sp.]
MRPLFLLLAAAVLTTLVPQAAAQAPAAAPAAKVRVVTRNLEPFSFDKEGRRVGYAAELWDQLARETGLEYDVQVVKTAQEIIDAVKNKTADVGVGAISVTAKREEIIDFTQPFYESGLQVLVAGGGGSFADNILQLLGNLFSLELIGMFLLLIGTMFLISHLVWRYEHKVNGDQWPEDYKAGIWESFWWTLSTLLVGGADNKGPVGVGGRIVAIVWMLLSIVLVSLLTASFTTVLTVNSLKGDINGPGDLPGRKVATVKGSTTEGTLTTKGVKVVSFLTPAECVVALKGGDVQAVVYDAPVLQYEAGKMNDEKLQMVGPVFERQNYAFALQQDSPLRERLNQALLKLSEQGVGNELRKKYFGEDQ